jgi:hypothetical protein
VAHVLWIYLKNINKSYMLAYVFVEQSWYGGVVKKRRRTKHGEQGNFWFQVCIPPKKSVHFVAGRSGSSTARRLPIIYRCFSCFVGWVRETLRENTINFTSGVVLENEDRVYQLSQQHSLHLEDLAYLQIQGAQHPSAHPAQKKKVILFPQS